MSEPLHLNEEGSENDFKTKSIYEVVFPDGFQLKTCVLMSIFLTREWMFTSCTSHLFQPVEIIASAAVVLHPCKPLRMKFSS